MSVTASIPLGWEADPPGDPTEREEGAVLDEHSPGGVRARTEPGPREHSSWVAVQMGCRRNFAYVCAHTHAGIYCIYKYMYIYIYSMYPCCVAASQEDGQVKTRKAGAP